MALKNAQASFFAITTGKCLNVHKRNDVRLSMLSLSRRGLADEREEMLTEGEAMLIALEHQQASVLMSVLEWASKH